MPNIYNNNNSSDDMPVNIIKDKNQITRLQEYNVLMQHIESLAADLETYYAVDINGHSKPLTISDYSAIIDKYTSLQKNCENYFSNTPKHMTAAEKSRHNIVNRVNNLISKDIESLKNADKSKTATLNEVITKGRASNISLGQNNVDMNKENVKIHLKTASGAKGSFTTAKPDQYSHNLANVAIAELLGQGKLYSKISAAQIAVNGKTVEGVYSTSAEGEKLKSLGAKSPLLKSTVDDMNKPNILKQLNDIQLIDFICGNPKRTADSLAYKFEKDENGKDQLTGVEVINDSVINSSNSKKAVMELDDIKEISDSSYEALKNLNRATIKTALTGKMPPKDIEAVCERVDEIKDAVEKKKINVVDKENWIIHPVALEYIRSGGNPLYCDVYSMYKQITEKKISFIFNRIKDKSDAVDAVIDHRIVFQGGENISEEKYEEFMESRNKFADMGEKLAVLEKEDSESGVEVSKEYKELCLAIKDVDEYTKLLNEKYTNFNAGITEAEYEVLNALSAKVTEKSIAYTNSMEGKELNETDRKHIKFANSVKDITPEALQPKDNKSVKQEDIKKEEPENEIEWELVLLPKKGK